MKNQNKETILTGLLLLALGMIIISGAYKPAMAEMELMEWESVKFTKSLNLSLKSPEKLNLSPITGITKQYEEIYATITAYNTVVGQTDSTPCIGAGGYVCGRTDIIACPRNLPLGSRVIILGRSYTCMDRTALKYDGRFDISFDKDIQGAKNFGIQKLKVSIIK